MRRRAGALAAIAAALLLPAAASATGDFRGETGCAWGAHDCTRPAFDPVHQIRTIRDHGDLLGFHMNGAPDVSLSQHWQGVQRLNAGGGRYMVVTRRGGGTSFVVVKMGSRRPGGERWRSNRIGARSGNVAPPPEDEVVYVRDESLDPGYHHSGGSQSAGDVLAVGLEGGGKSRVRFYDLHDPEHPQSLGRVLHRTGNEGAGTVSFAKLAGGRHLLIVGGTDANALDFYVTRRGTRLAQLDFRHTGTWRAPRGPLGIKLTGKYQNLDLITRPNGTMYLLGTYRTGPGISGNDFAHLFRVTGTFAHPGLKLVAKRHLYCGTPEGQQCNFIAAGGAYVSPSGRLFLYGVEHDNDGPQGTVKAEEFRPVPHRSTCDIVNDAYVELYDDTDFDGDRSVMIDYNDQGRRNYDDYDQVERFEDKASAARWCLPPGVKYLLYADKAPCGGRVVTLTGNGEPAADHRFKGSGGAVHGFNDEVSCSRWVVPTPTPTPTPVPTPTPTGVPTPTPTATPLPDLVITAFDLTTFTVSNQGAGPAGAFAVTVQGAGDTEIAGLAAGASATRTYTQQPCESVHQATADSHGQVMETNEFNNVSQFTPIC